VAPVGVDISGLLVGTTTLTVKTTGSHSAAVPKMLGRPIPGSGLAMAAVLLGSLRRRRRKLWMSAAAVGLFALILSIVGCGGGSGSGGTTDPGTAACLQ
jgi:MYXO-CTERM domain-containing protein